MILPGATVVSVIAGPPYVTDDPEPVAYRHWEVYLSSQWSRSGTTVAGTAPAIEANYGLLPEVQLSCMAQLAVCTSTDGRNDYGPGDMELGIKYRFLQESAGVPQISIYPSVEVPATVYAKGRGSDGSPVFIPLWIQKSSGPWTTFCGGGYQATIGQRSKNFWLFGWEGQRDLSPVLTVGAELFTVSAHDGYQGTEIGFNAGAAFNVSEHHHVLASIGRDVVGMNQFTSYLAYQLTI
jgi:hypothetical protein